MSLFDTPALTKALAGHDAVVNLATDPSHAPLHELGRMGSRSAVRTEGSAAIVDAATASSVPLVLQESSW